ncbi:MAG TPA: hypothetical protein VN442_00460 [Bryobacteraceae bacterium]|nr:hypothetical protein [Bryobacteraceae bacterium]
MRPILALLLVGTSAALAQTLASIDSRLEALLKTRRYVPAVMAAIAVLGRAMPWRL